MPSKIEARPILFSGPMVRALLDGTKTQTRRVCDVETLPNGMITPKAGCSPRSPDSHVSYYPYGQPDDLLWVRETWRYSDWTEDGLPWVSFKASPPSRLCRFIPDEWQERLTDIRADLSTPANYLMDRKAADRKWRPSIHMPRWASRLTLRITDVRVERVQDLSEADATAEGVDWFDVSMLTDDEMALLDAPLMDSAAPYRNGFARLWDTINAKRGFGWDASPWVWALTFEVIRVNVDQVLADATPRTEP